MDVIDRINSLLAASGKTGADMSRDLGFSNSIYSQWNKRKTKPSNRTLAMLAEYFGVTTDYLLGTEKEKAPIPECDLSADAIAVARAYDAATDKQKQMVKLALDM